MMPPHEQSGWPEIFSNAKASHQITDEVSGVLPLQYMIPLGF